MSDLAKIDSFKMELHNAHYKTLVNFMKNEDNAKRFMSSVMYSVQKNPKLLECDRSSVFNAFMTCAEFEMYPSSASGECYVIPYKTEAQFQLWYQGIVTLLYRAWVQSIRSEIIREKDEVEYINGEIKHKIDIMKSSKDRGQAVWVYVIIKINGQEITKAMNKDDILKFKEFSKSANAKEQWQRDSSPWNEAKDPELWMWRKTVLKQASKLLPKNDAFSRAIEQDNKDSTISDSKIIEMASDDIVNEKLAGFEEWKEGEGKAISGV